MPYGCIAPYPIMIEAAITNLRSTPGGVLDVGIGAGLTGAVMRAYFPEVPITGIELCPANRTPLWGAYQEIIMGDMRQILLGMVGQRPRFALGFLLDVLEHVHGIDGGRILDILPQIADNWFVGTPSIMFDFDTPGEGVGHKSLWSAPMLRRHGYQVITPTGAPSWNALGWCMHLAYRGSWDLRGAPGVGVVS